MLRGLLVLGVFTPALAYAHVKWFASSWHPAAAPVGIGRLLSSPAFLLLLALTFAVTVQLQSLDRRVSAQRAARRWLAHAESAAADWVPPVLRFGLAAYFIAVAVYFKSAPIILTPELKTGLGWMPLLQMAVAAGLLWRPGVVPACAAIAMLYGYAAHVYGWVHMLDYHFLLGAVGLLVLDAHSGPSRLRLGLLLLRTTVATSFMWVAVEKWLYPDWTHEILSQLLPPVLAGFDMHFSCTAAGFVEFALAFFILFGVAASQVAAIVLLLLLLAAIPFVGAVDAIGHLPLVTALAILGLTKNRWREMDVGRRSSPMLRTLLFPATFAALLMLYFASHQVAVAASAFGHWPSTLSHVVLAGAVGYWAVHARLRGIFRPRATR